MNSIENNILKKYETNALAYINGNEEHKKIKGTVKFYECNFGTIVELEVRGLPQENKNNFFGFHIHEKSKCEEIAGEQPFESSGAHFNPENDKHPNHVGDMPVIYSNDGYAYMKFYTSRFVPKDIFNTSVIIHEKEDDLMTDPSGKSGSRIACGKIIACNRY